MGKGKLHLIFVRVADRDHSVVRPHWASHPLPFLDDLPVGLKDGLADAGERLPAPVCESCDQLVNSFRWIHIVFGIPIIGYIYDSPTDTPNYAWTIRYVFLPVLLISGLWMWKGHVVRRLISNRTAQQVIQDDR